VLYGIDVSNWQKVINWGQVAASGKSFAFAKASEGVDYSDPYFAQNWAGIHAAGMVRGAYHFARPSENNAQEEVDHFLSCLKAVGGLQSGDLIVLDIEDTDVSAEADLEDWVSGWLEAVEEATGCIPILYSGLWYMGPHGLIGGSILENYPLWLAAYQSEPPAPPPTWASLSFWQCSSSEEVPGVVGPCDSDVFFGDIEALRRLGKQDLTILGHLDRLWHTAGLLDSISAHDLAGVIRAAVIAIKEQG
jgi:lysozyme